MQTKGIPLWSRNYTLVSAPSIGRFFYQSRHSFFSFRQLCLYISDSLHLFTLFLTDSLEKCQTKSFENEYSTFCNFQILFHKSASKNISFLKNFGYYKKSSVLIAIQKHKSLDKYYFRHVDWLKEIVATHVILALHVTIL